MLALAVETSWEPAVDPAPPAPLSGALHPPCSCLLPRLGGCCPYTTNESPAKREAELCKAPALTVGSSPVSSGSWQSLQKGELLKSRGSRGRQSSVGGWVHFLENLPVKGEGTG